MAIGFSLNPDRRLFLQTVAAGAAALKINAQTSSRRPETLVTELYRSLTPAQRRELVFGYDHHLRLEVNDNWLITPHPMGRILSGRQRGMVEEIFRSVHNPAFLDRVLYHVAEDSGGLDQYAIALFGRPGSDLEFVLTGRHCTLRCDGYSLHHGMFHGPVFYGHASGSFLEPASHKKNVYWYQAQRANELFQALNGAQQATALLDSAPEEEATQTVRLPGGAIPGLPVSELSVDQLRLFHEVAAALVLPFREESCTPVLSLLETESRSDRTAIMFYKEHDMGDDRTWDIWRIEGPHLVWYFRGFPHVHVWVRAKVPEQLV